MPWDDRLAFAGFSTAEPWLPVGPDSVPANVRRQHDDPMSSLSFFRSLTSLRRAHHALRTGELELLTGEPPNVLAYRRVQGSEELVVRLNLSGGTTRIRPAQDERLLLSTEMDLPSGAAHCPPELLRPEEGILSVIHRNSFHDARGVGGHQAP